MMNAETSEAIILVVDDIQDSLDLMIEVPEGGPWTVATAPDAESALKLASETAFDLRRRLRREPDTRHRRASRG